MQRTRSAEAPAALTLGEVIAAVMDVADDERQGTAVVVRMLRSGAVRLRRPLELAAAPLG